MSILCQSLTKLYGQQKAINALSFELKKGEIVGFLGPNGAGKSTSMKILAGVIPVDSGSAHVAGFEVGAQQNEIKKAIGYLPEHNPLYLELYVEEYLSFVGSCYSHKKITKARVKEVISLTGLSPERHKKIGQLSKGYRQRVGLAQAIIHEPDVLILDEPTTGLDPNQLTEIRQLIVDLGKEKTILFSTHIMQEVEAICDRVIILNQGQLVADDFHKNIKGNFGQKKQYILKLAEHNAVKQLQRLEGIFKVETEGLGHYILHTSVENDLRLSIFKYCVNHNLNLLELYEQKMSLEQAFKGLTV